MNWKQRGNSGRGLFKGIVVVFICTEGEENYRNPKRQQSISGPRFKPVTFVTGSRTCGEWFASASTIWTCLQRRSETIPFLFTYLSTISSHFHNWRHKLPHQYWHTVGRLPHQTPATQFAQWIPTVYRMTRVTTLRHWTSLSQTNNICFYNSKKDCIFTKRTVQSTLQMKERVNVPTT